MKSNLLILTLAMILTAGGLSSCQQQATETAAPEKAVSIKVVYDPSLASYLASLKEDFLLTRPTLQDGSHVKIELVSKSGVQASQSIASGELKTDAWISPSTSLVNFTNTHLTNLGPRQADCLQLFASPLIVAGLESSQYLFNAHEQEFSWNEFIEGQISRRQQGSNASVSLMHGTPDSSTTGLASLVQLAYLSEYQQSGDLLLDTLNSPQTLDKLRQYESFVANYGRNEAEMLARVANPQNKRAIFAITTEQQLAAYNHRLPAGSQRLLALYPSEGSYWEDHTLCISDADWVTPAHRAALKLWQDFIISEKSQLAARQMGYRSSIRQFNDTAPLTKAYGVNTSLPRQSFRPVSGEIGQFLLKSWPEIKRPLALIVALDTSGSMDAALEVGKDELRIWAASLSPRDQRGLLTFASSVEKASLYPDSSSFIKALDTTRSLGGSAVYDGLRRALDLAADPSLGSYRKLVFLYTDGGDKYSQTTLELLLDLLRQKQSTDDLNLAIVAIHQGDPGFVDLESIAQTAGGQFRAITLDQVPVAVREIADKY